MDPAGPTLFLVDWALGEALSASVRKVLQVRLLNAREIFLEEMRAGRDLSDVPPDDMASALMRYSRAAQEGAARRNLRLLAQVLVRNEPQAPALYADEFLRWADVIASLRREECIAVATLYRRTVEERAAGTASDVVASAAYNSARKELAGSGPFAELEDVDQALSSSARTGLVQFHSAWGGLIATVTPLMARLAPLIRLEDMEAGDD